jgi:hypothetical protein
MSFEAARKHGPFDTRWPSGPRAGSDGAQSSPPVLAADAAEELDWDVFSARYVRGGRRHNLTALSAYAEYRHGRGNGGPKTPRLRLLVSPTDPAPPAIEAASDLGAQRLLAAVTSIETWEGEGGSTSQTDEKLGRRHG